MGEMFGTTPLGIIVLDFILVAMGIILTPILWGIYKKLGENSTKLGNCIESLARVNTKTANVIEKLHEIRVRDVEVEGRIKGIADDVKSLEAKIDRHIWEDKNVKG